MPSSVCSVQRFKITQAHGSRAQARKLSVSLSIRRIVP